MTLKPIRRLLQPPTQQTCQSSNREPSVTAIHKRRNLVFGCMCCYGHQMTHSIARHSPVFLLSNRFRKTSILKSANQARRVATYTRPVERN
jgi:hypothetical protein